jgi:hypothetical protein
MIQTIQVAYMVNCMNGEDNLQFSSLQKPDWSRMPTGDKHITKYLVCIFPTIQRKFLFLLCPKIYQKTIFSAPESMKKQL